MRNIRATAKKLFAAASFELQNLESRTLMTAAPLTVKYAGGLLAVTGTAGDDQITVSHVDTSWTIANGVDWTVTKIFKAVTKLSVNGRAGNDTITLDSSVTCPATLLGDLGNDTISASTGASSINGGAGDDSLTAGTSNDILAGADG